MLVVVGVSHPALARPCSGGQDQGWRCFIRRSTASKSGGKNQPKQPALEGIASFSPLHRRAKHSHVEHGHACWVCCWIPGSRISHSQLQPRGGREGGRGNFCDFQLCTGPRCPGTTVVIESRWPFAVNAKLCIGNLCKSVRWVIDLCE